MIERFGAVKSGDMPLTVVGEPLEVGERAPDFILDSSNFSKVTLADSAGKVRLLSVVPSLATSICDQQTRRFDLEANSFSDDVVFCSSYPGCFFRSSHYRRKSANESWPTAGLIHRELPNRKYVHLVN